MRTIKFCGYTWIVKDSGDEKWGPGPNEIWNYFSSSSENVWVDSEGSLRLRITKRGSRWYCAEILLENPLGYGTYEFLVNGRFDQLDPSVVVGLFLYQDDKHEFDIEFARFNGVDNLYHSVQGADNSPSHKVSLNGTLTTHRMHWKATGVLFQSIHGHYQQPEEKYHNPTSIATWNYPGSSLLPDPSLAKAHINLWLKEQAPRNQQEVEVIITKFSFYPKQY